MQNNPLDLNYSVGSTTVARYNIDHSVDIYPNFDQRRWHTYRDLKDKRDNKLDLLRYYYNLPEYNPNEKNQELLIERGIQNTSNEIAALNKQLSAFLPSYDRKNTKKDGFTLNKNARRKIKYICHFLYEHHKKKKASFEFVTLTTPDLKKGLTYKPTHHDNEVSQAFLKFIKNLKKSWGLKYVVYVAERQNGKRRQYDNNGTNRIHYHCVFVWEGVPPHVLRLNYYWLTLLEEIGFKTFSKEKARILYNQIKKQYGKKSYLSKHFEKRYRKALISHKISDLCINSGMFYANEILTSSTGTKRIPNPLNRIMYHPVDIKKIKDIKGLSTYLGKYLAKQTVDKETGEITESPKIFARVWGGSKLLLKAAKKCSSKTFNYVEHILKIALENAKKHPKTNEKMIYQIQFKLDKQKKNSPVYQYTKIFLNESSKKLFNVRDQLLNEFAAILLLTT